MRNIIILTKKELAEFFNTFQAYIFLVIFLLLTNWFFFQNFFLLGQATIRGFFSLLPPLFMLLAPAISMRSWAQERRLKTYELLFTLPIRDSEAVLAKFFAALFVLATALLFSLNLPLTAAYLGHLDWGVTLGGYLGALLLGGVYLSIGLFTSSLTKNQLAAFIGGVGLSFLFFIAGEDMFLSSLPSFLRPGLAFLGLGSHFAGFAKGVIDLRDLFYYLSLTAFFLVLNIKVLAVKR